MTAAARVAAFHALCAVDDRRLDLPSALAETRARLPDRRDRALAADIVQGTLRWRRELDFLIASTARTGRVPTDPRVLTILRLSVYQLLHLDRVPASAVVDDAVQLTRLAQRAKMTGFVNACLRSLLRSKPTLPARPADPATREAALAYLGVTHSHPDWLVERWWQRYGLDAAEGWVTFNNQTPGTTLRVNPLTTTRDAVIAALAERNIEAHPTRFAPHGLVVATSPDGRSVHEEARDFVVQDEGSQLVALMVGARPGEQVLDLCAAPGGKTSAIAEEMQDAGVLVAADVRARRVRVLRQHVASRGLRSTHLLQLDRKGALPFGAVFDRVLVDAPCSGLGTVRRDPDIKWHRDEADLEALAAAQRTLLDRAAAVVRPGGRLVYATCSSEPEENDAVVDAFLAAHPEFELDSAPATWPAAAETLIDARGLLRTLPHRDGLDAFFAAPLRRR